MRIAAAAAVGVAALLASCGATTGDRGPDPVASGRVLATGPNVGILEGSHTPTAMRLHLDPEVASGGIWFPDEPCRTQFAVAGPIPSTRLDQLAGCLAGLHLHRSNRVSSYPDVAIMTYDRGIELEVMMRGNAIRFLGFVGRITEADSAPTITQLAMQAQRTDTTPLPAGAAQLWAKVCIDAEGRVTSVRPDVTSTLDGTALAVAAIRRWALRPVVLAGVATSVCSMMWTGDPALEASTIPPVFADEDSTTPLLSRPALGPLLHGTGLIVPGDADKITIGRRHLSPLSALVRFCVSTDGAVSEVKFARSTGLRGYDRVIDASIRQWRYRPVTLAGTPVRACSAVTFVYRQR